MTLAEFVDGVRDLAGERGYVAGQEVRRYVPDQDPETRWCGYVESTSGPGWLADDATPEGALDKLRARLAGPSSLVTEAR